MYRKALVAGGIVVSLALVHGSAWAQKKYGPGVTDTEIKIGNTGPYSGPVAAAQGALKSVGAYFDKVNAEGGINGRKVKWISLDDGFVPPKTVELTRKLVEQDEVAFMLFGMGTAPQLAVQKYLNDKKVPQLFVGSGASAFLDPQKSPWTMAGQAPYKTEGRLAGKMISQRFPNAKVAMLYQNDDLGKDYLGGLRETLTGGTKLIAELSHEVMDANVDSQIASFQSAGADFLVASTTQKFAALAIRRAFDTGWKPNILLVSIAGSTVAVLTPAGLDKSVGVMTAAYVKDTADPQWANDPAVKEFDDWMKKYNTQVSAQESFLAQSGYSTAQLAVELLKKAGNDLTRENILKQATSLKDVSFPLYYPGIKVNTSPTDYAVYRSYQFTRFNGKHWERLGEVISDR